MMETAQSSHATAMLQQSNSSIKYFSLYVIVKLCQVTKFIFCLVKSSQNKGQKQLTHQWIGQKRVAIMFDENGKAVPNSSIFYKFLSILAHHANILRRPIGDSWRWM